MVKENTPQEKVYAEIESIETDKQRWEEIHGSLTRTEGLTTYLNTEIMTSTQSPELERETGNLRTELEKLKTRVEVAAEIKKGLNAVRKDGNMFFTSYTFVMGPAIKKLDQKDPLRIAVRELYQQEEEKKNEKEQKEKASEPKPVITRKAVVEKTPHVEENPERSFHKFPGDESQKALTSARGGGRPTPSVKEVDIRDFVAANPSSELLGRLSGSSGSEAGPALADPATRESRMSMQDALGSDERAPQMFHTISPEGEPKSGEEEVGEPPTEEMSILTLEDLREESASPGGSAEQPGSKLPDFVPLTKEQIENMRQGSREKKEEREKRESVMKEIEEFVLLLEVVKRSERGKEVVTESYSDQLLAWLKEQKNNIPNANLKKLNQFNIPQNITEYMQWLNLTEEEKIKISETLDNALEGSSETTKTRFYNYLQGA